LTSPLRPPQAPNPPAEGGDSSSSTPSDKRKQSLYFPESMLQEINDEAARLERSLSWIVQRAWKTARPDIRKIPSSRRLEDNDAGADDGDGTT
jgi:uncharacterized small protein (TIGR04563 family)